MLGFLIYFFLLLLAGTLFVTGWFVITRGRIEIMPDGTEKKAGKIFKGWQFFWEQKKEASKLYPYTGTRLSTIIGSINMLLMQNGNPNRFTEPAEDGKLRYPGPIDKKTLATIEAQLGVMILIDPSKDSQIVKVEPNYRFPEWVRDPIATCITCHGSVYGTLVYWGALALMNKATIDHVFSWAGSMFLAKVFTWVCYCISLSFTCTWAWNKLNK